MSGFCRIKHIGGKLNLSDLFTKEDKDAKHFLEIRNAVMTKAPEVMAMAKRIRITVNKEQTTLGKVCSSTTIKSLLHFYISTMTYECKVIKRLTHPISISAIISPSDRRISMRGVS